MATIVTRSGKGSPLTHAEVDANFTNLNTDKLELSGGTMTGNLSFGDNNKAIFGAGSDLQIYHDGFNSKIVDSGSGSLMINATDFYLINSGNTANIIRAIDGAQVDLYHNASIKLTTTSTGIDVTGNVTADGVVLDYNTGLFSTDKSLSSYSSTNGVYLNGNSAGYIVVAGDGSQRSFMQITGDTHSAGEYARINVGGSERLRITSDGSVGIGDSAPISTLEISKSDQTNGTTLTITNAFSGGSWAVDDVIGSIDFRSDDASSSELTRGRIQSVTDNVTGTNWSYGTALTFSTAFNNTLSERLRIDSSGNVGIGSSTANHFSTAGTANVLGVKSTSGGLISIAATGTNFSGIDLGTDAIRRGGMYSLNGSHLAFYTNASNSGGTLAEAMRIDSSGNVGIGTSSPSYKLDVNRGSNGISARFGNGTNYLYTYSDASGNYLTSDTSVNTAIFMSPTSSGIVSLLTANTERMRIDSSGNVGIGTTSPDHPITIQASSNMIKMIDAQNTSVYHRLYSASDSSLVLSADAGSANSGQLRFFTTDTERMRIDSSGNLLVGTSNANPTGADVVGASIDASGEGNFSVDGAEALRLNRKSSDGEILNLRKDGSTVGSIGTSTNTEITLAGQDAGIGILDYALVPTRGQGVLYRNSSQVDLGMNNTLFKDLYLSGGVYLGGTGSANKLDDYEEGFHEPTVTMSTSGSVTLSTSFDRFSYTKIGRLVTITGNPRIDSVSSPVGGMTFTLPFTSASGASDEKRSGFVVNYYDASAGTGAHRKFVSGQVSDNSNVVTLDLTNSFNNNITPANGDEIYFNFSYIVP